MTAEELIAFEADVAAEFNAGHIRAPVHLSGGCEDQIIEIFRDIKPEDWVCTNWRSHYHCLLKGVPPEWLRADILAGKSITLTYPYFKIFSSAIVGGSLPIALGIALGIKRRGGAERVYCFLGDMTARTGSFYEVVKFATGFALPISFIVEDNGISVCTPTADAWGTRQDFEPKIMDYFYRLPWPHSGAGVRVEF